MTAFLAQALDEERALYLEACRARTGRHSPCRTCPVRRTCAHGHTVRLRPDNADVWRLWSAVDTQWRSGDTGLVGLDYPAVWLVAEVLGLDPRLPRLFRGLQALERQYLTYASARRAAALERARKP